ncbi:hypothetical protein JHK82_013955 [Glycine max]|nr:hypothetical protein JHK85_012735 [Glycine max]KAG5057405.1 hypothetical protein JHK86_012401 [Glycine max]KAG5155986.1 hypothetical protein JHK82_013955 [Glycine max]
MFNMMIYMHKKVGSYEQARKTFALMVELGIQQTTEVAERLWTGWEDERIEKNENSGTAVEFCGSTYNEEPEKYSVISLPAKLIGFNMYWNE